MRWKALTCLLTGCLLCVYGALGQEVMDLTQEKYTPAGKDITDIARLMENEGYRTALPQIDSLLNLNPDDDALHYYKASCLYSTGDIRGAITEASTALQSDTTNSAYCELLFNVLSASQSMQDRAKADSLCAVMIDRFPSQFRNPYTLTIAGNRQILFKRNAPAAIKLYDEALTMDEEYFPALLGKAEAYRASGRAADYFMTVKQFTLLPQVSADYKSDYLNEVISNIDGTAYRLFNKEIDSIIDTLALTNPSDSAALTLAGRWYYSTNRKDKGIAYFTQFKTSNPDNFNAEMLYVSLLMSNGTREQVIEECNVALKHFKAPSQQVQLLCIKADNLYQSGRKTRAFRTYDKALRLEPDNLMTLNNYAYFLSLERLKLKKAEKMSRQTVDAEPENVSYLDTYGYILYLLKRYDEAKVYFKKAIIFGGKEDEAVLRHYSLVLDALGEHELAQYYRNLYEARLKGTEAE